MKRKSVLLLLVGAFWTVAAGPSSAQEMLGTNMGIPTSSPTILWPRGMSIEALSPNNLYPNGAQFGLSNTSGGFGTSGSGPISGVGLAQRSVSSLVQEELERPYSYIQRLSSGEGAEATRSQSLFSSILGTRFRAEMPKSEWSEPISSQNLISPSALPTTDSVLSDRPATVDAILRGGQ